MVEPGERIEIRSKIAGVTHEEPHTGIPRQKIIKRHLRPGTKLTAIPEPDNPYGDNAIGLWVRVKRKRYHLGYFTSRISEHMADVIAAGAQLDITVKEITGGTRGKDTRGVNIYVRYIEPAVYPHRQPSSVEVATPPIDFSGEREYHVSEDLRITSQRVQRGNRNYLLPDISSVKVHKLSKATGCGSLMMAIGIVGAIFGALIIFTNLNEPGDIVTGLVFAAICAGFAGVGFLLNANVQERYAVDIVTKAGDHRLMVGKNADACRPVAAAVNQAIGENATGNVTT